FHREESVSEAKSAIGQVVFGAWPHEPISHGKDQPGNRGTTPRTTDPGMLPRPSLHLAEKEQNNHRSTVEIGALQPFLVLSFRRRLSATRRVGANTGTVPRQTPIQSPDARTPDWINDRNEARQASLRSGIR